MLRKSLLYMLVVGIVVELLIRTIIGLNLVQGRLYKQIKSIIAWHESGIINSMNQAAPYVRMKPNPHLNELNTLGFHSPEIDIYRTDSIARIAYIGGSTTFDRGPITETYPYFVHELLNNNGYTSEYINAGVPGYTSTECLFTYYLRIEPLNPDLIVFYNGRNELMLSGNNRYGMKDLTLLPQPVTFQRPGRTHQMISRTFNSLALLMDVLGIHSVRHNNMYLAASFTGDLKAENGFARTVDEFISNINKPDRKIIYEKNLETLAMLTTLDSTQLLLVGFDMNDNKLKSVAIPQDRALTTAERQIIRDKLQELNEVLEEVAVKYEHIYYYDLNGKIDRDFFMDDCHLTLKGKQQKANLITRYIMDNQILSAN